VATYRYDGFWRRTKKVIGASTRDYYYSLGWQVLEDRVGGSLDRQFVWGIRHIDDLVLRERGSERLYAVHDAMHVTAVVNDSGAVQERYGYDGFGRPRVMTAAFAPQDPSTRDWETLFDGYRFDRETGLYQVRFRYLHAELGRWMSRDPLDEDWNLYTYCSNDPLGRSDPSGLFDLISPIPEHPALTPGAPIPVIPLLPPPSPPGRNAPPYTPIVLPPYTPLPNDPHDWYDPLQAAYTFLINYRKMRKANTIGADKYFHCMAHCESAKKGAVQTAAALGAAREFCDILRNKGGDLWAEILDSMRDLAANLHGLNCPPDRSCKDWCSKYRPKGLDPRY
jgi:RHS repeat-associated protein